ncbi:MAG TPA: glycosyltransferase family 39 protein [Bacteroidales bacterium]|nr:glycosyltransferase family 39 protein [Bacteroidales bacterium]
MLIPSKYNYFLAFRIFLILWLTFNLLQAGFTDLNNDEAYYWMYSQYPAWGYFDHPPMIAFMIGAGYQLFNNELGVRLLSVLFMAGSLIVIWKLIDDSDFKEANLKYFILLAIILPVFNIYGFIATPDSPLIFFSLLFLLAYKKFLEGESWSNMAFMGITMAAMMYSKYHAALFIIFVILSNPELLKKPLFYFASFLALILFIPHIYWQFENDFPSFRYHLVDRVSGLNPENIPEYLGNLVAIQNPVILPLAVWLTFRIKAKNKFDRALRFIFYGFMIFFLLASLRYRVQPQWTSLMAIPVFIIVFRSVDFKPVVAGTIKWGAYIMIPIFLIVRSALAFDFLPVAFLKDEFHDYKKKVKEISDIAGDRPVVFTNSYQDPSVYTFYTGKFSHSLDNLNYRRTQYGLWDFEEKLHGKEVLYVPHWPTAFIENNFRKYYFFNGDSVYMKVYTDFQSLQKECVILPDKHYDFSENSRNSLQIDVFNPYPYQLNIKHSEFPVVFQIDFFSNGEREERWFLQLPDSVSIINPGDTITANVSFDLGELSDTTYNIVICSETGVLYDTFNSKFSEASVRK